jgi:cobalamin-dependent methionine synthase I
MLETVEQIENAIVDLMIQYQEELTTVYNRVDFVTEQAEKLLETKEKELDKKYQDRTDTEQAEKEYLEEYKLIKSMILEGVENALKKDSEEFLNKIS